MTNKVRLSAKRIADHRCPDDKDQAFLIDIETPNLYVRIRPRGKPAFLFVGSFAGKPVNLVIGNTKTWTIPAAQEEARRMRTLIDRGIHPKLEREDRKAETTKAIEAKSIVETTVGDVWKVYVERGLGKKSKPWSATYKKALLRSMEPGGKTFPRCGERRTVSGPLFYVRNIPLQDLDDDMLADIIGDELERIGERRPGSNDGSEECPPGYAAVKNAVEWLSGMYRWAASKSEYKKLIHGNPARSTTVQDDLPSNPNSRRLDFVEVPQLRKFFQGLAMMPNRTITAYLTGLLITGARRNELARLKWSDINFTLKKYVIADKSKSNVERIRTLPLTPLFETLVKSMPKIDGNDYVFAVPKSKHGYVQDTRKTLAPVVEYAEIDHLTPHGLRRTFSLLGEAAGCPSGAIEQAMGHAVAGMDEHYKPRRVEMLRGVMTQLEEFVIEQSGMLVLAQQVEEA